jgi:hypothetical protein
MHNSTDNEKRQFPLRLPADDYNMVKSLAFFTGRSMNAVIVETVQHYLAAEGTSALRAAVAANTKTEYSSLMDKLAKT